MIDIGALRMKFENMPEVRVDLSEEFSQISEHLVDSVLDTLAQGGKPAWPRTTYGAIARLYDRFASTVRGESDSASATVWGGGSPDTFAHQFGVEFTQEVTEGQRNFFWAMFYQTGDEKWKGMALSNMLRIKMPERSWMEFQKEDVEFIENLLAGSIFDFEHTLGK